MTRGEKHNGGLDPDLVEQAQAELAAIEAGQGPMYDELVDELGRFSLLALEMQNAQEAAERIQANIRFFQDLSRLLPQYREGQKDANDRPYPPTFELAEENAGYLYRQIQAHVLWDRDDATTLPKPPQPYFVIGRGKEEADEFFRKSVELLLLPCTSIQNSESVVANELLPLLVTVASKDLKLRDQVVARMQGSGSETSNLSNKIDKRTGKLILRGSNVHNWTPGSIALRREQFGRMTLQDIEKFGIQMRSCTVLQDGVAPHIIRRLNVDTHIAQLASVFRITEQVHALLAGEKRGHKATIESLSKQNQELRTALRQAILGTGLIGEDEVDRRIAERFPELG
jgi:hypothetical protein